MKIFVKCLECGYVVYTDRREVFALLGNNKHCNRCKHILDLVTVGVCDRSRDGVWCNSCQFRFQCFSSEPIGKD
jgi:transposase-like protein